MLVYDKLGAYLNKHSSSSISGCIVCFWNQGCGGFPTSPPGNMTPSMLRRQLKNLVQNYSEAEVKVGIWKMTWCFREKGLDVIITNLCCNCQVREATSNDPWGPSSSQMADISDLTYNVVACNEIMTMLWKRLKDDRNWRHIHKVPFKVPVQPLDCLNGD